MGRCPQARWRGRARSRCQPASSWRSLAHLPVVGSRVESSKRPCALSVGWRLEQLHATTLSSQPWALPAELKAECKWQQVTEDLRWAQLDDKAELDRIRQLCQHSKEMT